MSRFPIALICALAFLLTSATVVLAEEHAATTELGDEHGEPRHRAHTEPYPHHWIAIFAGGATETGRTEHSSDDHGDTHEEESTHTAGAIGFEYYLAFSAKVGAGVLVEHLGSKIDRNYTVFLPLGYHPSHSWRFVVAPGMEFTENAEEWALRLGVNYIIPVGTRWELSPEIDVDFIEGGKITYVYGVMLGFML